MQYLDFFKWTHEYFLFVFFFFLASIWVSVHRQSWFLLSFPHWDIVIPIHPEERIEQPPLGSPTFRTWQSRETEQVNISYRVDPSKMDVFAKISAVNRVLLSPKLSCSFEGHQNIDAGEPKSTSLNLPASGKGHILGETMLLPVTWAELASLLSRWVVRAIASSISCSET